MKNEQLSIINKQSTVNSQQLTVNKQQTTVKYFFLSDGWEVGRVWEFGGLWNEMAWRRRPEILRLNIGITEHGETLWLYQVEEAVLMVEVRPNVSSASSIGQVVLKRLMNPQQAIAKLSEADNVFNRHPS